MGAKIDRTRGWVVEEDATSLGVGNPSWCCAKAVARANETGGTGEMDGCCCCCCCCYARAAVVEAAGIPSRLGETARGVGGVNVGIVVWVVVTLPDGRRVWSRRSQQARRGIFPSLARRCDEMRWLEGGYCLVIELIYQHIRYLYYWHISSSNNSNQIIIF